MVAVDIPILELQADVDDDGSVETGVFELGGNATVSEQVQKDYTFDNTASGLVSLVSNLTGLERQRRQGFYLDIGAGAHLFEIDAQPWRGDNSPQFGDGSGTFPADATGNDPRDQMQCFGRYVQLALTDSFTPATLYWGEYADGTHGTNGAFDPLQVAVSEPRTTQDSTEQFNSFDVSVTCIEVLQLDQPVDLIEHIKRGAD